MDSDVESGLRVMVLAVNATGCALLSVLVVSVSLSQRLHRRDPVVNNFLYTWILLSALASFDQLAVLAKRDLGNTTLVREAILRVITIVSTLNLSIHLWYIMRSPFHQSTPRVRKMRTLALVVTPYIFGLFPLYMLHSDQTGTTLVGLFTFVVSLLTPITDAVLLVYYWRWHRRTRKTKIPGVMSLSFFVRLLAFSLYQLSYTVFLFLGAATGSFSIWSVAFKVLQNLFPLLAFCVIGLHTDILQLWFPCFWKRGTAARTIQDDRVIAPSGKAAKAAEAKDGDQRHLLETGPEGKDADDTFLT